MEEEHIVQIRKTNAKQAIEEDTTTPPYKRQNLSHIEATIGSHTAATSTSTPTTKLKTIVPPLILVSFHNVL